MNWRLIYYFVTLFSIKIFNVYIQCESNLHGINKIFKLKSFNVLVIFNKGRALNTFSNIYNEDVTLEADHIKLLALN